MIVKRNFYNRNTVKVAKDLLGCFLVREYRGKITHAMIVETEAYRGFHDVASHAARGRTPRTEIMFGDAGYAYVYLIYGMYSMLNVVTEGVDYPAAVLIRGVVIPPQPSLESTPTTPPPLRGTSPDYRGGRIMDGPGKLTKFLHIDKTLNGHDLTLGEKLWIERRPPRSKGNLTSGVLAVKKGNRTSGVCQKFKIIKSPRVGVDYARHSKEWKWNFKIRVVEEKVLKQYN